MIRSVKKDQFKKNGSLKKLGSLKRKDWSIWEKKIGSISELFSVVEQVDREAGFLGEERTKCIKVFVAIIIGTFVFMFVFVFVFFFVFLFLCLFLFLSRREENKMHQGLCHNHQWHVLQSSHHDISKEKRSIFKLQADEPCCGEPKTSIR